jgi:hypothetical protein
MTAEVVRAMEHFHAILQQLGLAVLPLLMYLLPLPQSAPTNLRSCQP